MNSFVLLLLVATARAQTMSKRNMTLFPPCMEDDDCKSISAEKGSDFKCFQYMCFPWNDDHLTEEFKTCRTEDCGEDEGCWRHWNTKDITKGICLHKSELEKCEPQDECSAGLSCVNGYCGDPSYLEYLSDLSCAENQYQCQDLLDQLCCYDLSGPHSTWREGEGWKMRCCNNEEEVIPPKTIQSIDHKNKLEKTLQELFDEETHLFCKTFVEADLELDVCKDFVDTEYSIDEGNVTEDKKNENHEKDNTAEIIENNTKDGNNTTDIAEENSRESSKMSRLISGAARSWNMRNFLSVVISLIIIIVIH